MIYVLARLESANSSILGDIAKPKRVVGKNQDFMQMRLLQYCNVIGCGVEDNHMQMRCGCTPTIIG